MAIGICSVKDCGWHGRLVRSWCMKHYKRWYKTGDPEKLLPLPTPYERLVGHGYVRTDSECFISNAPKNYRGYAYVSGRGAHRISYETWFGAIERNQLVDHICHNRAASIGACLGGDSCEHRACINPGHLALTTPAENIKNSPLTRQGHLVPKGMPALNAAKTHCPQGHPYSGANLRTYSGRRACKECHRVKEAIRMAKKKASR